MQRSEYIEKSSTLIGTKRKKLIDEETGEIIEVDQITKKVYGQKNFWKLYLNEFIPMIDIVENKQLDIILYILENTHPSTNMFLGTYKTIQKNTHASQTTIAKVMKNLQKNQYIKKFQNGVWQINPNIMMKGNESKRQLLLSYFLAGKDDTSVNKIDEK